jgi:putative spermidine/putrescine transport system permease protein
VTATPIAPIAASRARPRINRRTTARWTILVLIGGYLLLPLFAMLDFSTRDAGGARTLDAWFAIGGDRNLVEAIVISLQIAALTVLGVLLLLVPTMTWAYLKVPIMKRPIEFLCLLPLAIPAIVLVVGIAPIYSILRRQVTGSPLTLVLIDVILVLPFAHRAIDAGLRSIDVNTLAEAARSLGASWPRVIGQIIVPNIRGAILSAAVIAIALVLGEFTISSLLNYDTVQVVINLLGKRNAFVSVAVSLGALVFAFLLIVAVASVAPSGRRRVVEEPATGEAT